MRTLTYILVFALGMSSCVEKPAGKDAANNPITPSETAKTPPTVSDTAIPGFQKEFDLQGIHFVVEASNGGSINQLTITPSGLSEVNDTVTHEIDGTVSNAEVADINADGSPEIYVWVNSAGSGSYGNPIGYSANRNKSLSEIYFPPISDDPVNSKGYQGHDEFAVVEGVVAQRFPVYAEGDINAKPTGKIRQLQYKLTQGEASWVMKLDKVTEF